MKKIIALLFAFFIVLPFTSKGVSAADLSNVNFDTAVEIKMNTSTNTFMTVETKLDNFKSATEQKVYKITLPPNSSQKLTLVTHVKKFDVDILDGTNIIEDRLLLLDNFGVSAGNRQSRLNTTDSSTYYIVLTPSNDSSVFDSFPYPVKLTIGEPIWQYSGNTYSVVLPATPLTSSSKVSFPRTINLSNITSIPEGSILRQIRIDGTQVGDADGKTRSIRPASTMAWIDSTIYDTYTKSNLDGGSKSSQIIMRQSFEFRHSVTTLYTTSYTLTPTVYFDYKTELR